MTLHKISIAIGYGSYHPVVAIATIVVNSNIPSIGEMSV